MAFTYVWTKRLLSIIKSSERCMSTLPVPPYSTLFFGSDKFSLNHLDALKSHWAEDKSSGSVVKDLRVVITSEHSPVARYAKKNKLEVLHWKALVDSQSIPYDMGVVVSFGRMIPKQMIDMFPCGVLNVHPSDLPKYRGATPIQHTILHGEKSTAVCVMKILPHKFDEGPVYKREEASVGADETFDELRDRLADIGTKLLLETMADFPNLKPVEQQGQPSLAPKLTHMHSMVDWHNQTQQSIYRQHLALGATYALTTKWGEFLIRFPQMLAPGSFQADDTVAEPGSVKLLPTETLAVCCKDGWVGFKTVIHKKKRLTADNFYKGHLQSQSDVVFESMDNKLEVLKR